jgi:oligosaccharide repeat unit polymerase
MVYEKILAIVFSLLILGQAELVRRYVGTWIFPACIFGGFWFLFTFVPLVALASVPIEPYSVGFILICCTLFSVTSIGYKWRDAFELNRVSSGTTHYDTPIIRWSFYSLTAVAVISLFINTYLQGFSAYDIVFHLLSTSGKYIGLRYSGDLKVNIFSQLSVVLVYPAAGFGGLVYATSRKRRGRMCAVALSALPSVLTMLIQGAKGTLFLALTLFWAGILVYKISSGDKRIFSHDELRKIFLMGVLLFPVLVISFLARGLYESTDINFILHQLFRLFASYSSAHLYAFSDWFSHVLLGHSSQQYDDPLNPDGFYTFMAVFKLLGSTRSVPDGTYGEYFQYGDILQTNIYTIFRGLIMDFGFVGTIVFMLSLGFFLHASFWQQLINKRSAVFPSIFIHSIGFFYTSFVISLFTWNSIFASIVVVALVFFINNWWCDCELRKKRKV